MKILFATSSFAGGGITSYAHEVINNYALNHEVCVFIGDDSKSPLNKSNMKIYNPLIVEISYGFIAKVYDKCEGYWDKELNWHKGENFDFCGWMVELVR